VLAVGAVACWLLAGVPRVADIAAAPARPNTEVGGALAGDTVWTQAMSPVETTETVLVPAGVTLAIEPGVVVRLGPSHELQVAGALQAVGSPEQPIRFEASSDTLHWGTVLLAEGSGPSEIAHAEFSGGGSRRREMLGVATDDAVVRVARFTRSQGVGLEIKAGASPTITGSTFDQTTDGSANPPAALRILGPSDATIVDNFFQSNYQAVNWQADANPTFVGNRFDYNGLDGVVVRDTAHRPVTWANLGPREWAYYLQGAGVTVGVSGTLSIEPGVTVKMFTGAGLRVDGTLAARGTTTAKILFTTQSAEPKPGQWQEIAFGPDSADYDPETGGGSVIEHAIIEYGGSSTGRSLFIRDSSPRIANTILRHSGSRGVHVTGETASPSLVGVRIEHSRHATDGVGLLAAFGATPQVAFSTLRDNVVGLRLETGATGRIGPHNGFELNTLYGAQNADVEHCVDASGNDWGAASGPSDLSSLQDACGLAENLGDGDEVTDSVNYLPFEGTMPIPIVDAPSCGTTIDRRPTLQGIAPASAEVVVYDNQLEIGRVETDEGQDGVAAFQFTTPDLEPGSHVLQVQAASGELASGLSSPLELYVDPDLWIDPEYVTASVEVEGARFVQGYFHYVGEEGCLALRDDHGWQVRQHPGSPVELAARLVCPGGATPVAAVAYLGAEHAMADRGDAVHAATFEIGPGGPFDVLVTCGGRTRSFALGTISIEYDGVVYDAARGILERVEGAEVTLLEYVPAINNFAVWNGGSFFGQTNPQRATASGWYAFYPPPGRYRVRVDAEGYDRYLSTDVDVTEQPVVLNIGLSPRADRLYLPALRKRD
jgi:hypothetical protein